MRYILKHLSISKILIFFICGQFCDIFTYSLYQGGSIQTIFPTEDERMLLEAAQLAREARSSRQFTDVQKFTLMCIDCKIRLNGQAAAQQHAKDTGHTNFGEVAA